MQPIAENLIKAARHLCAAVEQLGFGPPVTRVYNPLAYAWKVHEAYLKRYGDNRKRVIFLGMNPGPFGMVQTGVPFGEVRAVRDWMAIEEAVGRPGNLEPYSNSRRSRCSDVDSGAPVSILSPSGKRNRLTRANEREHPKRPVLGFACPRSEVSGRRLWNLFANRFGKAENFFAEHFVVNYCPLAFFETTGRNRTPDKLPAQQLTPLLKACDEHLRRTVEILQPEWVIGVGRFAEQRAKQVFPDGQLRIGSILHPSPANPAANRDWEGIVTAQLNKLGVWS
ncbi:MAG: uracil-DNA glycosylase family protein [Verrucomicrobiota bacterium]